MKLNPVFPHWPGVDEHAVPADMIGATILAIGTPDDCAGDMELAIIYQTAKGERRTLRLGFSECGMWRSDAYRHHPSPDASQEGSA